MCADDSKECVLRAMRCDAMSIPFRCDECASRGEGVCPRHVSSALQAEHQDVQAATCKSRLHDTSDAGDGGGDDDNACVCVYRNGGATTR